MSEINIYNSFKLINPIDPTLISNFNENNLQITNSSNSNRPLVSAMNSSGGIGGYLSVLSRNLIPTSIDPFSWFFKISDDNNKSFLELGGSYQDPLEDPEYFNNRIKHNEILMVSDKVGIGGLLRLVYNPRSEGSGLYHTDTVSGGFTIEEGSGPLNINSIINDIAITSPTQIKLNSDLVNISNNLIVHGQSQFILPTTFENAVQINNTLVVESSTLLNDFVQINNGIDIYGVTSLNNDLNIIDGNLNMIYSGVNLLSINTTSADFYDNNINTNGQITTSNLNVNSISTLTPIIQTTNTITLNFGSYAIGKSWSLLMVANINSFVFSGGVIGGIYKIWLTNNATSHILFKANNIINTMAGDISVGPNAVFLLEIYKYTSTLFRMKVSDFT